MWTLTLPLKQSTNTCNVKHVVLKNVPHSYISIWLMVFFLTLLMRGPYSAFFCLRFSWKSLAAHVSPWEISSINILIHSCQKVLNLCLIQINTIEHSKWLYNDGINELLYILKSLLTIESSSKNPHKTNTYKTYLIIKFPRKFVVIKTFMVTFLEKTLPLLNSSTWVALIDILASYCFQGSCSPYFSSFSFHPSIFSSSFNCSLIS